MTRRLPIGVGLLALGAAASVFTLLGAQSPGPGRLDLAFRRFHLSWETGAAILWPLLVVRPELAAPAVEEVPGTSRSGSVIVALLTGWLGLLGGIGLGAAAGVLASASTRGIPAPGDPAVPAAMALTLTTLYLLASALALGARHPWRWLVGLYLVPNGLAPLLEPLRQQGLLDAVWRWVSVGRLGPGTLLEVPALVGGLVLEPEWQGIDPWRTLSVWLLTSLGALGVAFGLRRRSGETGGGGGDAGVRNVRARGRTREPRNANPRRKSRR